MVSFQPTVSFKMKYLLNKIDEDTNNKLELYINDENQKKLPVYIFVEAFCTDGSKVFFDGENYMERCSVCADKRIALTSTPINGSERSKKISAIAFHCLTSGKPKSKLLFDHIEFKAGSYSMYPNGHMLGFILGNLRGCAVADRALFLKDVDPNLIKTYFPSAEAKTFTEQGAQKKEDRK